MAVMRFFLVVLGGAVLGAVFPGAWAAGEEVPAAVGPVTVVVTVEMAAPVLSVSVLSGAVGGGELGIGGFFDHAGVAVGYGLSALLGVAAVGGVFLAVLAFVGIKDFRKFIAEARQETRDEARRVATSEAETHARVFSQQYADEMRSALREEIRVEVARKVADKMKTGENREKTIVETALPKDD